MTDRPPSGGRKPPHRRGIRLHPSTPATPVPGLTDRPRVTFEAVSAAALGRWPAILAELGVDPARLVNRHGPCPGCGGSDRFRFDDLDGRGTWYCSGGGEPTSGDGFALLAHVHGWTPADALHRVAEILGMDHGAAPPPAPLSPPAPARQDDETARHARAAARAMREWDRAPPAPADHRYLAAKGLPPMAARIDTASCAVTFRPGTHRRVMCDACQDRRGCLLLPVYGPDGSLLSLARIAPDGSKHFDGPTRGGWCAVQEGDPGAPAAIAEGYASAAAVALAATSWRVLCAFSAGQLPAVAAMVRAADPERTIYAATDPDPAGRAAADRAAVTARALPLLPPVPGDWDDFRRSQGLEALREAIKTQELQVKDASAVPELGNNLDTTPSVPSNQELIPSKPLRNPFGTEEATSDHGVRFSIGALIEVTERGPRRLIDSAAAVLIAGALRDRLAYDHDAASWLLWSETHWATQPTAAAAEKLIADMVHVGTAEHGFRLNYLTGITAIITRRGLLPPPTWPRGVVPFANGLLDLETRALRPASPGYALDWCLPHDWDPAADCPTVRAWLASAVEQDQPTVELLRAWLAALVRGIALQKFMLMIGRGGSGKGTFQRLAMALVGNQNAAVTTLRDLEENRFETAKLYGKRLALVSEAGHHGGALNVLKAVTGGDPLSIERKHVQQSGSFVFGGLVLMATNEQLTSTDATSGLERRRVTVRFPRSATPAERADWHARGGEHGVLHSEIPGLIRWLLDLPETAIRAAFEAPPARVAADNLLGMAAGNSVADWLMEACIPGQSTGEALDPFCVAIGDKRETRVSGVLVYENADARLYPNYLTWCTAAGRKPVSLVKFGAVLSDMAETLGYPVVIARHPENRRSCVYGLRLRHEWERPFDWARRGSEGVDQARRGPEGSRRGQVIDRKEPGEFGQTFTSNFSTPNAATLDIEVF